MDIAREESPPSTTKRAARFLSLSLVAVPLFVVVAMYLPELYAVVSLSDAETAQWGLAYPDNVSSSDASAHVGEFVQVCGTVAQEVHEESLLDDLVFLNFDDDYPDQTFTAWGGSIPLLGQVRAESKEYEGRFICVQGAVENFEGIPQIKVDTGDQIRPDFPLISLWTAAAAILALAVSHRTVYPQAWK